jgi:hypothetical protein
MLAGISQYSCLFSIARCPWDTYKYSSQCCEIQSSIMKCSVEQNLSIHDTFVQRSSWRKCRIKFRRKYPDSAVQCKASIYNIETTRSVLVKMKSRKTCTDWRKTWWHRDSIRSKPEEVVTSFGSSEWVRRKYSSHWYKVSKVTTLQNYSRTLPFAFRLRSKNTILQVVSGIGIQWTFRPSTYVLLWRGVGTL